MYVFQVYTDQETHNQDSSTYLGDGWGGEERKRKKRRKRKRRRRKKKKRRRKLTHNIYLTQNFPTHSFFL